MANNPTSIETTEFQAQSSNSLSRTLSPLQATALNMIDMVGIGPFVTLPLVAQIMGGAYEAIFAWFAGAVLALLDGIVWAELGSRFPLAGGSYAFLREVWGKERWGKMLSFLFLWQTMVQAPLVVASGAIGFAQYASFVVPLNTLEQKIVSGGIVLLIVALLYRKIESIGKLSVILWIAVIVTMSWLIISGFTHFDYTINFISPQTHHAFESVWTWGFWALLGQASIKTIYSYLGYYNVCHLGGEISSAERVIPRSIFISIIGIAILYLGLQFAVFGVLPTTSIAASPFIVSTFIEKLYGHDIAIIATGLVLVIAFSSLFAVLLGYSRIPFAAASVGEFFPIFGRLHKKGHFPYVSLLFLGGLAFVFSLLFKLSDVIKAILAMRILVQFIAGALGLYVYRTKFAEKAEQQVSAWKMPLFPVPIVLAIGLWIGLFFATGYVALTGIAMLFLGSVVYLTRAYSRQEFPFEKKVIKK